MVACAADKLDSSDEMRSLDDDTCCEAGGGEGHIDVVGE